jgi:hypothetical protein
MKSHASTKYLENRGGSDVSTSVEAVSVDVEVVPHSGLNLALSQIEADIRQLYGEEVAANRIGLEKALLIGEKLTQLKDSMPHGEWGKWVDIHLPFDQRTAQKYMFLHKYRHLIPKCEPGTYLRLNATCKLVARLVKQSKSPDSASQKAAVPKSGESHPRRHSNHSEDSGEELVVAALTSQQAEQVLEFLHGLGVDAANYQVLRGNGDIQRLAVPLQEKLTAYLNRMEEQP